MPFKSEKQRRYMFAKQPEIAKRWAKKYPTKDLPMYADNADKEKRAVLGVLGRVLKNNLQPAVNFSVSQSLGRYLKKADSKLEHIQMPQHEQPTYSGEKPINSILKPETEDEGSVGDVMAQESQSGGAKELLRKIAIVAGPEVVRETERRKAQQTGQAPQPVPNNVNVKQYPVSPTTPPPMDLNAPAPAQQAAPQQQPAPNPNTTPAVGGGASPNARPIDAFGGISATGDLTGNSAQGVQHAAGAEKLSSDDILGEIMSINSLDPIDQLELDELWLDNLRAKCAAALKQQKCSCGCGQKVAECTCSKSCSCRQKNGSCYGLEVKTAGSRALDLSLLGLPLATGALGAVWGSRMGENQWMLNGGKATDKFNNKLLGGAYGGLTAGGLGLIPALINKYKLRDGKIYPREDYTKRWQGHAPEAPKKNEKEAGSKPGLWANIHAKRKRGGKPAKPGDQDYPDSKSWTKTVKSSGLLDFLSPAETPRLKTTKPVPANSKQYKLQPGQVFEAPHATADSFEGQLGVPEGYKYLGDDGDGNPVLKDPDGNLVSMFHETGDLQKIKSASSPAWQRSAGKNPEGGLNEKGRKSYERETGGNLKAPVTEKNPTGKAEKRQNSFCSRMCGMKRVNTGAETKADPESRINKSLSKWNCKCGSALEFGLKWGQLVH